MGQSNGQRKERQRDLELWELYEDGSRNKVRNTRSGNADRSSQVRNVRRSNNESGDRNVRNGNVRRTSGELGDRSSQRRNVRRSNNESGGRSVRSGNARRTSDELGDRSNQVRNVRRSNGESGNRNIRRENVRSTRGELGDRSNQVRNVRRSSSVPSGSSSNGRRSVNTRPVSSGARPLKQVNVADRSGNASQLRYIQPYSGTGTYGRSQEYGYQGNARPTQSIRRRRARRRKMLVSRAVIALLVVLCLVMIYFITGEIYQMVHRSKPDKVKDSKPQPVMAERKSDDGTGIVSPELTQDFLEINEYSRPGDPMDKVNSIFVHYTANPGTSAAQNRSYFANLALTHERSASAHLIIGYEGEIIQCIPFDEQAYAVMTRNEDSISIECCYLSEDGSFTQETYDSLIHTLAWLLDEFNLSTDDILRHYDCGGKLCPLYYAEHEDAWKKLQRDVADYMAVAGQ